MIKKLALATIILAITCAVRADVIVQDANTVIIAGRRVGTVVDALLNNPTKRAEIQFALRTRFDEITAARQTAETKALETQDYAASLAARAKVAHEKGDRAAMALLITEALTPAKERKRIALEAEKARLDVEAAALAAKIDELTLSTK